VGAVTTCPAALSAGIPDRRVGATMAGWSQKRAIAVHEAGHAVTAWLLGRQFKTVSIGDGRRHGRFKLAPAGDWDAPATMEDRAVVLLAGSEAERVWSAGATGAAEDWLGRAAAARALDLRSAGGNRRLRLRRRCGPGEDLPRLCPPPGANPHRAHLARPGRGEVLGADRRPGRRAAGRVDPDGQGGPARAAGRGRRPALLRRMP
jgi:hypothetical protein